MILLLFGSPGSGKGTQARLLSEHLGLRVVSTGELLRVAAARDTPLGRELQLILATGKYVGDQTVNEIVNAQLDGLNGAGMILDGYPRTVEQASFLDTALAGRGCPPPTAVHLEVPKQVLVKRLTSRAQCPVCQRIYESAEGVCGNCRVSLTRRDDDDPEVVLSRLETYLAKTAPVIQHYSRGTLVQVDGNQPPDRVFEQIFSAISPDGVQSPTHGNP